jgi:hypothetical protein
MPIHTCVQHATLARIKRVDIKLINLRQSEEIRLKIDLRGAAF